MEIGLNGAPCDRFELLSLSSALQVAAQIRRITEGMRKGIGRRVAAAADPGLAPQARCHDGASNTQRREHEKYN
jgi:hypothetical protein